MLNTNRDSTVYKVAIMASSTPPSFLKACQAYLDYQQNLTTISLPPYDLNADGQMTIQYGENFCRMPNCQRRMVSHFSVIMGSSVHYLEVLFD
jgi:hypothetical protein